LICLFYLDFLYLMT